MRAVRKAFTLVEILIVVVILGILAAIVVPQFTSATQDAQGGNLLSQLETLNSQTELFRAKYNEYPPNAAGDNPWEDDITLTNGDVLPGGMVGIGYLKGAPRNPYNNSSEIGDDPATAGWTWFDLGGNRGQWIALNFNNDPNDTTRGDPSDDDQGTVYGQIIRGNTKLPDGTMAN